MESVFEILADRVLSLFGRVTRRCGRKTQIVLDVLVISAVALAVFFLIGSIL